MSPLSVRRNAGVDRVAAGGRVLQPGSTRRPVVHRLVAVGGGGERIMAALDHLHPLDGFGDDDRSFTSALHRSSSFGLAFAIVRSKSDNYDEWIDDKHTDYPPSFCFIGNLSINGRINNHPYFKSENQYSNYKDNWQPCT